MSNDQDILSAAGILEQEEIIDPGMDVHTVTTTSAPTESRRSRGRMPAYSDRNRLIGTGTNSISGTDDDDLDDDDLDDDDDDEDVDVDGLDDQDDAEGVVNAIIDIREPLINLKRKLEAKLEVDLSQHDFYLQDTQPLHAESTLVDQCIQGEGPVQINVQIKEEVNDGGKKVRKINIVDVLKPSDDVVAAEQIEGALNASNSSPRRPGGSSHPINIRPSRSLSESSEGGFLSSSPESKPPSIPPATNKKSKQKSPSHKNSSSGTSSAREETVTRWIVCSAFRKEQERLNIPTDPTLWDPMHVAHWASWAKKEFPEASFDPTSADWSVDGNELCSLSHEDFKKKVAYDPGDMMWTHLELLRKCKFVAIAQKTELEDQHLPATYSYKPKYAIGPGAANAASIVNGGITGFRKTKNKPPIRLGAAKFTMMAESSSLNAGSRSGNNGQVQLWQFLLELLTEKDHRHVIHWVGNEGEFKLENPETVAHLWGTRKNKPNMNYEKLSRALRYYYDGDMISRVHGKRFAYKFVCDLKSLIGYTASELNSLVMEAEQKANGNISIFN